MEPMNLDHRAMMRVHSDGTPEELETTTFEELSIRRYHKQDREGVLNLCHSHYKSLALPSVQYYCEKHSFEILVLLTMGFIQTTVLNVVGNFVLFGVYLYIRALLELKKYCRTNCSDLENVEAFYLSKPKAEFFVAELNGKIVACGGIRRSRFHDTKDAQILRLVVDHTVRRQRIGSRVLNTMENFAREEGYERIFLNTSNLTKAHIKFVTINEFSMTACIPRYCMRGDLLKWRKTLTSSSAPISLSTLDVDEQNVY
eukprot:GHVH01003628.1.p1 GENE.GHVH01003628.1~~GHVH01003628.1.p1  ORF type:complete len:257 (+),score=26.96 GHVH01003628.1:242-1012(+)